MVIGKKMDNDECHMGPNFNTFKGPHLQENVKGKEFVRSDVSPMGRILSVDKAND